MKLARSVQWIDMPLTRVNASGNMAELACPLAALQPAALAGHATSSALNIDQWTEINA